MPVTANQRKNELSQRAQYQAGGVGRWYWDYRDRVVLSQVNGKQILDAGCGEGITLEKLQTTFPDAEIQGIDIDPKNIDICKKHDLPVTASDLYSLPFADTSFDTCLFLEVIEHLDEPGHALSELARVTRPGGRLIVVYPVDWAFFATRILFLRFKEAFFDPGHLQQWSHRKLRKQLLSTGWEPIEHKCLPLWPPFMLHGLVVSKARG